MSVLVHAEVDGDRLEEHEIIAESLLILIGGDETTRHVISGGAYQLLAEPQRWRTLVQDPSLLPGAIEEMLRWVSPVKNMARQATSDIELGGQLIPEGEKLLLLYPSANRDETVFSNPNEFDIRGHPTNTSPSDSGPTFASDRVWPDWSCGWCSRKWWPDFPTCSSSSTASRATDPRTS